MLNKGYDPDTLRAMTLAAKDGRDNSFAFHVDGAWWLVTGWIEGNPHGPFRMRASEVWINGQWVDADEVLSRSLLEALNELLQVAFFPSRDKVSNAQA